MQVANLENIAYHHICRNPILFRSVEPAFYLNPYIRATYEITKKWYQDFGGIPFDINDVHPDQLKEVAKNEFMNIKWDDTKKLEEHQSSWMSTIEILLSFEFNRYNADWAKTVVEGWAMWQKFQRSMKNAVEYQKTVKITVENVSEVISTTRNIITNGSMIAFDKDDGVDFMDPESHKQTLPSDLFRCRNEVINQWKGGGFEGGTLTHLWGASNIGKSIFLTNFALDFFMLGYNVLLVSLEMATHKLIKRAASNAFNVNMNKYSDLSQDSAYVGGLIKTFRDQQMSSLIPLGNFWLKRFSSATVGDIQAYALKKGEELGINWHMIVIDYLGEVANSRGVPATDMYMYHKTTNDDMFKMAVDNHWGVLTAHQLKAMYYGVDDYGLNACGESTGIIHRTDDIMGIMQTPEMKANKQFKVKYLKARDSAFKDYYTMINVDYDYMRLTGTTDNIAPNYF